MVSSLCPPSQVSASLSYAKAVSVQLAKVLPARARPANTSQLCGSRACNLVLFGLPESCSIFELKSDIDELLEYLTRK